MRNAADREGAARCLMMGGARHSVPDVDTVSCQTFMHVPIDRRGDLQLESVNQGRVALLNSIRKQVIRNSDLTRRKRQMASIRSWVICLTDRARQSSGRNED